VYVLCEHGHLRIWGIVSEARLPRRGTIFDLGMYNQDLENPASGTELTSSVTSAKELGAVWLQVSAYLWALY